MSKKFIVYGILLAVVLVAATGAIIAQDVEDEAPEAPVAWVGIALVEENGEVSVARVQRESPADKAGLSRGDVIVTFDEEVVVSASQLSELVQSAAPGDVVVLAVLRDDETVRVEITLGSLPTRAITPGQSRDFDYDTLEAAEVLLVADLEESENGYEVLDVFSLRNPFDLVEGDIITAVNEQPIDELDWQVLLSDLATAQEPMIHLTVLRDGDQITLEAGLMELHFGFDRGFGRGRDFGRWRGPNHFRNLPGESAEEPESTPPVTEETSQA